VPLLVVDEVGYIPFDPEAANLMFSLVSARYERARLRRRDVDHRMRSSLSPGVVHFSTGRSGPVFNRR